MLFIGMYLSYILNILKICVSLTLKDKAELLHGGGKAIGIYFLAFFTVGSTQRRLLRFAGSVCLSNVLFQFRNGWLNVSFYSYRA
jgi:hypothetical protein